MDLRGITGEWFKNITDMIVDVFDESGYQVGSYNKDMAAVDNPITKVTLELDSLGLLMRGNIVTNRRLFDPPYSLEFVVTLVDDELGTRKIARGFQEIIGFSPTTVDASIDLKPIEDLELDNLFTGQLPITVPGVTTGSYNMAPGFTHFVPEEEDKDKLYTNREVLDILTKRSPTLAYGVDGYGRSIIGTPELGVPVIVPTSQVIDLAPNNHVINDYFTTVASTGEKGWRSYLQSREVGRLTPRKFKEVGAAKTKEVTATTGGPNVLYTAVLIMSPKRVPLMGTVGSG